MSEFEIKKVEVDVPVHNTTGKIGDIKVNKDSVQAVLDLSESKKKNDGVRENIIDQNETLELDNPESEKDATIREKGKEDITNVADDKQEGITNDTHAKGNGDRSFFGGKRRTRGRKSSRRKQKGSSRRNRRKSNKRKRRNKK